MLTSLNKVQEGATLTDSNSERTRTLRIIFACDSFDLPIVDFQVDGTPKPIELHNYTFTIIVRRWLRLLLKESVWDVDGKGSLLDAYLSHRTLVLANLTVN